jgi:signal transduction histidine kinase
MQVLVNLVSNAIKFTHVGGITISTFYAHHPDRDSTHLRVLPPPINIYLFGTSF